jgi:hypothetical protein
MTTFWQSLPSDRLLADVSLWSAHLAKLEEEIRRVDSYADLYHIDVSDGHFTQNLLFFPELIAAVRPLTSKILHVHLMVEKPLDHVDAFIEAGADITCNAWRRTHLFAINVAGVRCHCRQRSEAEISRPSSHSNAHCQAAFKSGAGERA